MPTRPPESPNFADIEAYKEEAQATRKKSTHKETWKAFERLVASDFGTTRTPLSGMVKTITNSDTLHPKIYVECKLRGSDKDFAFWNDFEKHRKKEVNGLLIHDKKIGEKIILMQREDFFKVMEFNIFDLNLINFIELPKLYKSVLSLYLQTQDRAEIEGKLPVVAIKKKNKKGYLIGTNPSNFEVLHKFLKKKK